MGRLLGGVLALLAGASIVLVSCSSGDALSAEELMGRSVRSMPTWRDYQEDIKGQIGAGSVATWRGHAITVSTSSAGVSVTFELSEPWAGYEAAIPILLRVPEGSVYRADAVVREGMLRRYFFSVRAGLDMGSLPWVEVHYPHTEQRIMLDAAGSWRKTVN